LLSGRDVIGIAQTGSGKTLTFLIPAMLKLSHIAAKSKGEGVPVQGSVPRPKMLIVAPTRELAMQSHQVVVEMGGPKGVCIYGGVPKGPQKSELSNGAEIVVATPGRLLDLIEEKALTLAGSLYLLILVQYAVVIFVCFLFFYFNFNRDLLYGAG
jgi:ATP-dependent RNA helicase DBP3